MVDALLELGDPVLDRLLLARVGRRHVRARQQVEPLEHLTRVTHVTAHRRVGPAGLVGVEAQVEPDELADLLDRHLVEAQLTHPVADHARTDDVVMVERDRPVAVDLTRLRLSEVMQQRGETQHDVRPVGLQRDRVLDHGERVVVDVLVPVLGVDAHGERTQLRDDVLREPGPHEQVDAARRCSAGHQAHQLVADALGRDGGQRVDHGLRSGERPLLHLCIEHRHEARHADHAQRIVAERDARIDRRDQPSSAQVREPAVRIDEREVRHPHGHRVDGEVSAREVVLDAFAELDARVSRARHVGVGAERGDLDGARRCTIPLALARHRAERCAGEPDRVGPAAQDALGLLGTRRRREVEVDALRVDRSVRTGEQRVAHRSAHEVELVPGRLETFAELAHLRVHIGQPPELGGLVGVEHVGHGAGSGGGAIRGFAPCEPSRALPSDRSRDAAPNLDGPGPTARSRRWRHARVPHRARLAGETVTSTRRRR